MLYLLSPAKTLDFETPVPAAVARHATEPVFTDRAAELIGVLRDLSPSQVAARMDLSDALATLNVQRYAAWSRTATPANSKPAVLAFDGDVYDGLDARTLSTPDLRWAQSHLAILSGLYGLLRPLDRLQPYRLEMGTALETARGHHLYAYWGDALAEHLNALQQDEPRPVVVNLASQEYARAVPRPALRARVVDIVFEDVPASGGGFQVVGFHAKRARGAMARYAVLNRIGRGPQRLQGFAEGGYAFAPDASAEDRWVFRRAQAPAPKAGTRR